MLAHTCVVRSSGIGGLLVLVAALVTPLSSGPQHPVASDSDSGTTAELPPTGNGVDISFPQCVSRSHIALPANFPFAVVGVNGGTASTANPCFESEYNSALLLSGRTGQPHAAVYVNTGNPALAATWWPTRDATQSGTAVIAPDGTCDHAAGAACAYVYGYSMAEADYRRVRGTVHRVPRMWWLDVETTNTWQSDKAANSASLAGMVDYLQSRNLVVGIYSTSYQWAKIAGTATAASPLAGLRSWLAGGSEFGAPADCQKAPLTPGGRVAMIQYVTYLDNDFSCRQFHSAVASVAPSVPSVVGSVLSAVEGVWAPGASYTYQWNRDNTPIPGATDAQYTTTAADLGEHLSVTITGRELGYSTKTRTSAPVSVLGLLGTEPVTIQGSFESGTALTAVTAAWGPGTVSLTYSWYRGGRLVSSGTAANQYVLSGADVGKQITLRVTGSEPGYAAATESAVSQTITP